MSALVIDIRSISKPDIPLLEEHISHDGIAKHTERFLRQQTGEVVYLIAWHQAQPVGHALLKWDGSQEEYIVKQLQVTFPEIEDIYVLEAFRSQGIGSQLIAFAEWLVWEKGCKQIGLSVGVANESARRLYEKLGYRDAQFGEYTERGEYLDSLGNRKTWEETLIYLIKQLIV